jgi:hypothetical protein
VSAWRCYARKSIRNSNVVPYSEYKYSIGTTWNNSPHIFVSSTFPSPSPPSAHTYTLTHLTSTLPTTLSSVPPQPPSSLAMSRPDIFYQPPLGEKSGLPHDPFKSFVIPRPIGWISTTSKEGQDNLAPFSQFTNVSFDPPTILFIGHQSVYKRDSKDSVRNARDTGEFVWNMSTWVFLFVYPFLLLLQYPRQLTSSLLVLVMPFVKRPMRQPLNRTTTSFPSPT